MIAMFRVAFLIKIDERTGNAVSPSGEGQCLKKGLSSIKMALPVLMLDRLAWKVP